MTQDEIHEYVISLGAHAPKCVYYANGTLVAFRNGDGRRVATILEPDLKPDAIKDRLASLYKIRPGNQARQETLDKVFPRKVIQEHQEAKKHSSA